jgi:SAM-dependent methyltransferase
MTEAVKTDEKARIREEVRKAYAARVVEGTSCCGPSCCSPDESVTKVPARSADAHQAAALRMGYSAEEVEAVPENANLGLGCGAPLHHARPQPGEAVLDLGSGAGFDAFLAAQAVGSEGKVIGVDMTPEMLAQARVNAEAGGYDNVEFRQGLIEAMPVEDGEVDVIISNCVINLSPDKAAVFREAYRVLSPGGRVAVSDIVLTAPLPEAIAESIAAYVGCVAGASLLDDYIGFLRDAGFEDIEVVESRKAVESLPEDDPIVLSVLEGTGASSYDDLAAEIRGVAGRVLSAKITARKP